MQITELVPNSLAFDQLEELSMSIHPSFNNITEWIDFIMKHQELKVLVKGDFALNLQQYMTIVDNLPDLVEIEILLRDRYDKILLLIIIITDGNPKAVLLDLNL